jgi:hypothetical protein
MDDVLRMWIGDTGGRVAVAGSTVGITEMPPLDVKIPKR